MITAKVVGVPGLMRKFKALEQVAQERMLEAALVSGALVVQNRWKQLAPYRTGTYRRSIHIGGHTGLAGDFQGSDIGRQEASAGKASVIIGTNLTDPPYPVFLEQGTSKMAARPSAGPAFQQTKDAAIREVANALHDLIEKAL